MSNYYNELINSDISFEQIRKKYPHPSFLYKYQYFFDGSGNENIYWQDSMRGIFHFSLPKEFEDKDDCKPIISKKKILELFKEFLEENEGEDKKETVLQRLSDTITEEWLTGIQTNYQKDMYIGCLTDSPNNPEMWKKYSENYTGYCMEYEVDACEVFAENVFPVCYTDNKYDISHDVFAFLLLECQRDMKQYSIEESLKVFQPIYKKILKCSYIPVLIKNRIIWSFEKEWRVMLLKHRTVYCGIDSNGKEINRVIKSEDYLNGMNNIDTNGALKRVFLGKNFKNNPNAEQINQKLRQLSKERGFQIIEMEGRREV